jgi:hypothetical protein
LVADVTIAVVDAGASVLNVGRHSATCALLYTRPDGALVRRDVAFDTACRLTGALGSSSIWHAANIPSGEHIDERAPLESALEELGGATGRATEIF